MHRPAGNTTRTQAQRACQLPQGLAAHTQAQSAGLQLVELAFTKRQRIFLPQVHPIDARRLLRVAQGRLPVVVDEQQCAVLVRRGGTPRNLGVQQGRPDVLEAQLHQAHPHVEAAQHPFGIAHHGIQPPGMAGAQHICRHGGKRLLARRRAQQGKVAAQPGEFRRRAIECGKDGRRSLNQGVRTAKSGFSRLPGRLQQHNAAVGMPARRLWRKVQWRMQPAAGFLRDHVGPRPLLHLARVGQHGMPLLRQGRTQILPAALRPACNHCVALLLRGRCGNLQQRLLPVQAMNGQWRRGGAAHASTTVGATAR